MGRRILIVNDFCDCGRSYKLPFEALGTCVSEDAGLWVGERDVDLVVFTGGADVDPALYGEHQHFTTYVDAKRDQYEVELFRHALSLGIPMLGICRGAQFLCVMAGGKLVQNMDGHQRDHKIRTRDDRWFMVSSVHHQMQLPPEDAEVLGWSDPKRASIYEGGIGDITPDLEFEVVAYQSIRAVGLQYHPEIMDSSSDGFRYCQELAMLLLNG